MPTTFSMSPADVAELRAAVAAGLRLAPVVRTAVTGSDWRKRPTRNIETFNRMLLKYPDATAWVTPLGTSVIGLRAVTQTGREQRSALEAELGDLPVTITIRSPSGAETMLFSVARKLPDVELGSHMFCLGRGRSIALPPAFHAASGQHFSWTRAPSSIGGRPLPSLPEAWVRRIAALDPEAAVPSVRRFAAPSAPRKIAVGAEAAA